MAIGIDFATHVIVRVTGEGTGLALLAFASMLLFAAYGLLTFVITSDQSISMEDRASQT